jgi:putative transposase
MPLARRNHLPRLSETAYCGRQFVHWTMTIAGRKQGWLTPAFHAAFRTVLSDAEAKYGVVVPAYCLMPDHIHCLAAGVESSADQLLWVRTIRRRINEALGPFGLQKQAYDHVLRPAEQGRDSFVALVHYIAQNPIRSGLVERVEDWPFIGACVSRLPKLDPRCPAFRDDWWTYWNSLPE